MKEMFGSLDAKIKLLKIMGYNVEIMHDRCCILVSLKCNSGYTVYCSVPFNRMMKDEAIPNIVIEINKVIVREV